MREREEKREGTRGTRSKKYRSAAATREWKEIGFERVERKVRQGSMT